MDFIREQNAKFFLLCNSFLWGSSYVVSKMLLYFLPKFSILFITSFGSLIVTFSLFFPSVKLIRLKTVLPSIFVSFFSVLSNIFFMLALQYTNSSNAAFIVQTSILITPIISSAMDGKLPDIKIFVCSITAMIGLSLLIFDFKTFSLNPGDMLALCNALFFSLFLIGQRTISAKVKSIHFSFIHHIFNTSIFAVLACIYDMDKIKSIKTVSKDFIFLIVVSVFIVCVTALFQSGAIRFVSAERAVLIYAIEPLSALLLGWIILGEQLNGIRSVIGCIVILVSVVASNYKSDININLCKLINISKTYGVKAKILFLEVIKTIKNFICRTDVTIED